MVGGGTIIPAAKKAFSFIDKVAGYGVKYGRKLMQGTWVGRMIKYGATKAQNYILSNIGDKKWWGKMVRMVRTSRGIIGAIGKVGAALKRGGGLLGFLGKGLSIFDHDHRSPREFKRDMKAKEKQIDALKKKRDAIIKRELEAQKELRSPVVTEGLEDSAKMDVLAQALSQMKNSLATIQGTTYQSAVTLKGFESYQQRANASLGDAINYGTQANMKTISAGIEDAKDTSGMMASTSTETIVGELSGKMDAIEKQRQDEIAFRKKNDWKRKLFDWVLLLLDWYFNWRFKLIMMAVQLLLLALGPMILRNIDKIMLFFQTSWRGMLVVFLSYVWKLTLFVAKIAHTIVTSLTQVISGLLVFLLGKLWDLIKGAFTDLWNKVLVSFQLLPKMLWWTLKAMFSSEFGLSDVAKNVKDLLYKYGQGDSLGFSHTLDAFTENGDLANAGVEMMKSAFDLGSIWTSLTKTGVYETQIDQLAWKFAKDEKRRKDIAELEEAKREKKEEEAEARSKKGGYENDSQTSANKSNKTRDDSGMDTSTKSTKKHQTKNTSKPGLMAKMKSRYESSGLMGLASDGLEGVKSASDKVKSVGTHVVNKGVEKATKFERDHELHAKVNQLGKLAEKTAVKAGDAGDKILYGNQGKPSDSKFSKQAFDNLNSNN